MKKFLTCFSAILLISGCKTSKFTPAPRITGEHLITSQVIDKDSTLLVEMYIKTTPEKLYWGCNDTMINWKLGEETTRFVYEDNFKVTTIEIISMESADNLNAVMLRWVGKEKVKPKEGFEAIFSFYRKHRKDKKDWTTLLLHKTFLEFKKL